MARALAGGAGVALTYGFFDATQNATPPDTATVRSGGHATALEGVSRSGDDYTFQMSDPARTPETAAGQPEDPQRQSAFATTTWAAQRELTVTQTVKGKTSVGTSELFNLEGTGRYLDDGVVVEPARLLIKTAPHKLPVRAYVAAGHRGAASRRRAPGRPR